ncbi:Superoxide dismutase [Cu-Zn] precursor [Aquisphaera giovannonii]|uniref:Superoxide dismutase [Cu-Zn] n=1 Tax=Aquisphaera giovannonii TaxID=406548 RepID=A0A5B9WCV7_9BACT|nr:superoxide dismutase family protein [Aquisphaera giovannonii]QEH38069.1 Superoxide dismutase [Cu-Zn] precursor [Aquisphaera giovannonii]
MTMKASKGILTLAVGGMVCFGMAGLRGSAMAQHEKMAPAKSTVTKAVAILLPTKGSKVEGRVTFTEEGGKVKVHAEISGLAPGEHGFHIHEFGVWSEDGMAAGGHYNPTAQKHAGTDTPKRHVGDLGNITANSNGNATVDIEDENLSFHGPTSILGRGVVVHEKADDLKSQPSGNAGGRVAVGVVGVAKP